MCNKHDINGTLHLYFFLKKRSYKFKMHNWDDPPWRYMTGMTVLYISIYAQPQDCMMMQTWNSSHIVSCEVLSMERIKRKVFWNVTPSSSVDRHCFHSYSLGRREQPSPEHLCPSSWLHDIIFQQTSSSWKRSPFYQIQHTWDCVYTTYGNATDAMPSLISKPSKVPKFNPICHHQYKTKVSITRQTM